MRNASDANIHILIGWTLPRQCAWIRDLASEQPLLAGSKLPDSGALLYYAAERFVKAALDVNNKSCL